ncbi:MAG: response regulator [Gemmatimonadota bacterium]
MATPYFPDHSLATAAQRQTVLVVEDETALRVVVCRMLMLGGYDTLEAQDGRQALRVLRQREAPVDVVLTDLVMPVMDGGELASRLAIEWPGLPVIGMSAYASGEWFALGIVNFAAPVIRKPFSSATLLGSISAALSG